MLPMQDCPRLHGLHPGRGSSARSTPRLHIPKESIIAVVTNAPPSRPGRPGITQGVSPLHVDYTPSDVERAKRARHALAEIFAVGHTMRHHRACTKRTLARVAAGHGRRNPAPTRAKPNQYCRTARSTFALQIGQSVQRRSHSSMHDAWNTWEQGSRLTSSPAAKSLKQTIHCD